MVLDPEVIAKAVRPKAAKDYADLEGFFAGGALGDPATFLAAMGIAVKDEAKLFPIQLPPMPPRPSARSRRPKQRWGRAWALWSLTCEIIKMLNESEKPGGSLELGVGLEEDMGRATSVADEAGCRMRFSPQTIG